MRAEEGWERETDREAKKGKKNKMERETESEKEALTNRYKKRSEE